MFSFEALPVYETTLKAKRTVGAILYLMIAESAYTCGASQSSNEAIFACINKECHQFALACGRKTCSCMKPHAKHQMGQMVGLLEEISEPLILHEHLKEMQKSIDAMIDGLVLELQQLKVKHQSFVEEQMDKHFGKTALRKRLLTGEALDSVEATGHCFYALLEKHRALKEVGKIYPIAAEELKKQLETVKIEAESICSKIASWFASDIKYTFSDDLKHPTLVLSE